MCVTVFAFFTYLLTWRYNAQIDQVIREDPAQHGSVAGAQCSNYLLQCASETNYKHKRNGRKTNKNSHKIQRISAGGHGCMVMERGSSGRRKHKRQAPLESERCSQREPGRMVSNYGSM